MLFRNLLTIAMPLCLTMATVQGAINSRAEISHCPSRMDLDGMLPIMSQLDCEINLARPIIVALIASSPGTNLTQVNDAMLAMSKKMLDASANVRKLNWTVVETYARSADGSRLLSPEEIEPAAAPYFANIVDYMTVVRDYAHSKRQSHSHKRDVGVALFQSRKEYVYNYQATLMAGSEDYLSFASSVNFTGELHIQGGASVLNVQLNNVKLGLYNGPWQMQSSSATQKITALNSTLSNS